jgi:seryl-tRNA synthetase
VLLAAPVHETFRQREAFAAAHGRAQDYETVDSGAHLAASRLGLQSAVCDCCYYLRRDTADQPDRWYTTAGRVYRNEISPDGGLDRLLSFRVRDIMAVGSERFVRAAQERMLAEAAAFLERLGLTCRIETAGDPFFANDSVLKNLFQTTAQLKYELKVPLPHDGRDLAIGSVNLHQDFFGRSLRIGLPDGSPAWSACVGVGFERAAYAICCQHGPDPENWPDLDQGGAPA